MHLVVSRPDRGRNARLYRHRLCCAIHEPGGDRRDKTRMRKRWRAEDDSDSPRVSSHVFVDESKRRDYLLVAAAVVPVELDPVRKILRGLVLPGQRRLHMNDESESRRRSIAPAIAVSGTRAMIYDAGQRYSTEWTRRSACLQVLVADAAQRDDAMLILEQDDTLIAADRKLLYRAVRDEDCPDLRYEHRKASSEQLLALPDAIAWCWAKGGEWRRRIEPVVPDIRTI
jgi:hypothetical protein